MISKSKKKILDTFEKDGFIVIKNFFKKKIISDAKKEIHKEDVAKHEHSYRERMTRNSR